MPPLLCPSPLILDHSFPHSSEELRNVAVALGELDGLVDKGSVEIALTGAMQEFLEMFDWSESDSETPLLLDIYRFCSLLFLGAGHRAVRLIFVDDLAPAPPHPCPIGCDKDEGLVSYWCEEMGKVLLKHQALVKPSEKPFVGIACSERFAGEPGQGYPPGSSDALPLVGPNDWRKLADAFVWEVPPEIKEQPVSFSEAYRNLRSLGCERIDKPTTGSHYKAHFPKSRPWALDPNVDPLPHRFLAELEEITGLPVLVVRFALKNGRLPPRKLRIA